MLLDIVLLSFLIILNGLFAMAELAVVIARPTRLHTLVEQGEKKASQLLKIQEQPGEFLATIQIGITLVSTTASAIGGAEAIHLISPLLAKSRFLEPFAQEIALFIVIAVISYFSIVFGELIPKSIALRYADDLALKLISPVRFLSLLTHFPKRFLSLSSNIVLDLFGINDHQRDEINTDDIGIIVKQGVAEGNILPIEENLINQVFVYSGRTVREVMTPRTKIIGLELSNSLQEALEKAKHHGYSRYPVYNRQIDNVLGYVHFKDLVWGLDKQINLEKCIREIAVIPENATLPEAFSFLTSKGNYLAVIIDEFGGVDGLITREDLLEVIFGDLEDEHSLTPDQPDHQSDGEWVIPGETLVSDVENLLKIKFNPHNKYKTLAGFMMTELGYIPNEGDKLHKFGYSFTVITKERLRIVSVHIKRLITA